MPRNFTPSMITELTADSVQPRILFEFAVQGATMRYWNGSYDLAWDSATWLGGGYLKDFGPISASRDLSAEGLYVDLSGEPDALVSLLLNSIKQNRTAKLYLAFLNSSGAVIADPYLLYEGLIDTAELEDGVQESTLHIQIENKLIALNRPKEFRYNHETQQTFYPGDMAFEYVEQLEDWSGFWGRPQKNKRKKKR